MSEKTREDILDVLATQLSTAAAHPLMFVGSGFSQRYLRLPSWANLLELFCAPIKPFKYYLAKANGCLPLVASHMSDDYFEYAWSDASKSTSLATANLTKKGDVLKYFVCKYIEEHCSTHRSDARFPEEVQKLESLSVDAIITTNWDCYIEDIFPGYSAYVGQDEVVVSNPQGIGEIYKIHGCIKQPCSLVLTQEDYFEFNKKYAYLAAKLMTYLIEHPIIFLGYSLQDDNIKRIIESLAMCLGSNVQDKLRNNLIFVQRNGHGRVQGIESTQFKVQDHHVPLTTVTTDDFGIVYDAIGTVKRKLPVRVLRFLKEEIYEIAKTNDPKGKMFVADIDELEHQSDIEFVVGVGVKAIHEHGIEAHASKVGYRPISIEDIFDDVLSPNETISRFSNIPELLSGTLPFHLSRSANTPIFKYLRLNGITSDKQYKTSGLDLGRAYSRKYKKFRSINPYWDQLASGENISSIIENNAPQKAAMIIPHLDPLGLDLDELRAFCLAYRDEWGRPESNYRSHIRKLITIYDRLKFGWLDLAR